MPHGRPAKAMADKVDLARAVPSTGDALRKGVYFVELLLNFAQVAGLVERLKPSMVTVKVFLSVHCSGESFAVVVFLQTVCLTYLLDANQLLIQLAGAVV